MKRRWRQPSPRLEVRPSPDGRRGVGDRRLGDPQAFLRGADYHLGGELHPVAPQLEARHRRTAESAEAAVDVRNPGPVEQVHERGQDRRADVAVRPGHRALLDDAAQPAAHHQVVAAPQQVHELAEPGEVVRVVGVSHDDERAARFLDAALERAAVAPDVVPHDPRPGGLGDPRGVVGGPVVDDEHLAGDRALREEAPRLADARGDGLLLVQAGHQHRELDGLAPDAGGAEHGQRPGCFLGARRHRRLHPDPGRIQSRNLSRLITCCSENERRAVFTRYTGRR
jgi:hypothetical protein